jgi:hypothetical protein
MRHRRRSSPAAAKTQPKSKGTRLLKPNPKHRDPSQKPPRGGVAQQATRPTADASYQAGPRTYRSFP